MTLTTTMMMMMMMMTMMMTTMSSLCSTLHTRIANQMGEDSSCRGGIVNIRGGCSGALLERPQSSKALWRFRASTSNSPNGRSWPHLHTHMRYIDHTYAQQDIRVYEDDHFQPPKRQYPQPKALSLFRVSI
jgi:hypothetical protein